MNPEYSARLQEIRLTLPRLPEADRMPYLVEVCGDDPVLRHEAEALLPAAGENTTRRLPEKIGPFTILGILGEGGMGIVYRARRSTPFRRDVALKLIKRGMDSEQVIARFESERRALTRMEHPHIAKMLVTGADEEGRPYFGMELASGILPFR